MKTYVVEFEYGIQVGQDFEIVVEARDEKSAKNKAVKVYKTARKNKPFSYPEHGRIMSRPKEISENLGFKNRNIKYKREQKMGFLTSDINRLLEDIEKKKKELNEIRKFHKKMENKQEGRLKV